ncbi:hypothetical protein [Streptomyces sp. NPDC048442]|uniref:hypothetical protein n=1 Tax=Streptomyces sp. NPDC048442 TaxID=3154823 RepID=UPI00343573A1
MSDDVMVPDEMVAAQLEVEDTLAAVRAWTDSGADTSADRWSAAQGAAARAHELRAPLIAKHGSYTFTAALGRAMQEARATQE